MVCTCYWTFTDCFVFYQVSLILAFTVVLGYEYTNCVFSIFWAETDSSVIDGEKYLGNSKFQIHDANFETFPRIQVVSSNWYFVLIFVLILCFDLVVYTVLAVLVFVFRWRLFPCRMLMKSSIFWLTPQILV